MSLATWKKEFYPVEASKVSKRKALDHSIRKWTGLLESNLKRHGITNDGMEILESSGESLSINSSSCALCTHYVDYGCITCPLSKVRNNHPCDRSIETSDAPWRSFVFSNDAHPMLRWLKKAKRMEEAKRGKSI